MTSSGTPIDPGGPHQVRAVARVADRRGRDRDDPRRTGAVGDRLEVVERLDRAGDRLGSEHVVVAELARQAERRPRVLEHVEVFVVAQPEHDHPARVRADVDDRERPVVGGGLAHARPCSHSGVPAAEDG